MNVGLIVAAGSGTRFAGGDKQFVELSGRPLLSYSLEAFLAAGRVDAVVIVLKEEDIDRCRREVLPRERIGKSIYLVSGGAERRDSAAAGLEACPPDTRLVWIHDGARPLVTAEMIDSMPKALKGFDGVIAAVPAVDTVKEVKDEVIVDTIPRQRVWLAQTPQLFRYKKLKAAYDKLVEADFPATDDAQVMEAAGGRVRVLLGEAENLKVTTIEDLKTVEETIRRRWKNRFKKKESSCGWE